MLTDIKRDFINSAKRLGNYESLDITYLANHYCEARDTGNYSQNYYISALMLKFWPAVYKLYKQSPGLGLEIEDMVSWLHEAIEYACKYRAWQDPTKNISAQACINKCIGTIRHQKYYNCNLDKDRANYGAISLDNNFGDEDSSTTILDMLVDEDDVAMRENFEGASVATSVVQSYINKNKLIEAIILDTIAFQDAERQVKETVKVQQEDGSIKKYTIVKTEYWEHKLVKLLGTLPEDFENYFISKYRVNQNALEAALAQLRKANNQKLYKYVRNCRSTCRADMSSN